MTATREETTMQVLHGGDLGSDVHGAYVPWTPDLEQLIQDMREVSAAIDEAVTTHEYTYGA